MQTGRCGMKGTGRTRRSIRCRLLAALRAVIGLTLLFALSTNAIGYGGDTHYYVRYASALEACFDWDEAHLIASSDYLVDKNRTTMAEMHPVKKHNKINWHSFGRDEERFNALWERVLAEKDETLQLVKLGQFLHYLSDWEAHYGYGVRMGHGVATVLGRDPDSLGADRMNNLRMLEQTIDRMVQVCVARGRETWRGGDPDLFRSNLYKEMASDDILDEMFLYNKKNWKKFGAHGKQRKEIVAKNRLLVEQLIANHAHRYPDRGIPEDFSPGDPERGLPPPIGIRYDKNGEMQTIYGVEIELSPEYLGDKLAEWEEDALEETLETELVDDLERLRHQEDDADIDANLEIQVRDAELVDEGWLVTVRVKNLGGSESESGSLDIVVLDVVSEELLGESTQPLSSLAGHETIKQEILIESAEAPTKRVLIGAWLTVFELSADNNDAWFAPWKGEIEAVKGKKKTRKPKQGLEVEILGTPRIWLDEEGDGAWVLVRALVSGGHSSRRLENLDMALVGEQAAVPVIVNEDWPVVWMSIPDLRRRVVPAETLAWFLFDDELCAAIEQDSVSPETLEIRLSGAEIRTVKEHYPLPAEITDGLAKACAAKT